MAKESSKSSSKDEYAEVLAFRDPDEAAKRIESDVHVYYQGAVCETDTRGYPTPENRSPTELVVDASEGFIPLWEAETALRWRFQENSMQIFQNPEGAKAAIRQLLGEAIIAWGLSVDGISPLPGAGENADFFQFLSPSALSRRAANTVRRGFISDLPGEWYAFFTSKIHLPRPKGTAGEAGEAPRAT